MKISYHPVHLPTKVIATIVLSCTKKNGNGLFNRKIHPFCLSHTWTTYILRPGKLCAFCNLGERSQLGQGEFRRIKKPDIFIEDKQPESDITPSTNPPKMKELSSHKHRKSASRLVKLKICFSSLKKRNSSNMYYCFRNVLSLFEPVDEHSLIGHIDKQNISDLLDEEGELFFPNIWINVSILNRYLFALFFQGFYTCIFIALYSLVKLPVIQIPN